MDFNHNSNQPTEPKKPDEYGQVVATTRIKSMTPISDSVKPNERSDEYIATQDVINGPIANISIDSEQTIAENGNSATLPLAEHHHVAGLVIGGILALALATAFVFVFLMK